MEVRDEIVFWKFVECGQGIQGKVRCDDVGALLAYEMGKLGTGLAEAIQLGATFRGEAEELTFSEFGDVVWASNSADDVEPCAGEEFEKLGKYAAFAPAPKLDTDLETQGHGTRGRSVRWVR